MEFPAHDASGDGDKTSARRTTGARDLRADALSGFLVFLIAKTWKVGREQLFYFVLTAIGCLAVDLLVGVALGILAKLVVELALGARLRSLLRPHIRESRDAGTVVLKVTSAATFTNYLSLKGRILAAAATGAVIVDISTSPFVDHTTMERLEDLVGELGHEGRSLEIRGSESLVKLSEHPRAARRSVAPPRMDAA